MKARIFLYLFVFALLYAIFEFFNTKRYAETKEKEIVQLEEKITSLSADLAACKLNQTADEDGFSLQSNSNAREFFEDQQIDIDSLAAEIESQLVSKNATDRDNPYVPYSGNNGNFMRINRIKILNNRWILAEFTDSKTWGEALISYFLDENNQLHFDPVDGVLY